jgi:vancomycin resistance protein VanJ
MAPRLGLRLIASVALVLLPLSLWLLGQRSATASVLHGHLQAPAMVLALLAFGWATHARRRWLMLASLGVLCPALALSAVRALRESHPAAPPAAARPLELVSFNLLFSSADRGDASIALLRATPADLLCLQEVTPGWARRLDAALGPTHPHRAVVPRSGAYGLAIYSRLPISNPTLVRDARRVAGQCVALRLGPEEAVLCNVHLSSPAGIVARGARWVRGFDENARVRDAQWKLLRAHVARSYPASRHLIVAGDFNTLDTEPLYRTLRGSMVDAFAAAGEGYGATFPTEPTSPIPLVRIDYVFASPTLVPLTARVLPQAASDHRALRVTLAVPSQP